MPALSDAANTLLAAIALAIVLGLVSVVKGWSKGEGTTKPVEATVVSATVADARAIRDLVGAVDDLRRIVVEAADRRHSDSLAERDQSERIMSGMRDLCEGLRRATLLPPDMQRLLDNLKSVP